MGTAGSIWLVSLNVRPATSTWGDVNEPLSIVAEGLLPPPPLRLRPAHSSILIFVAPAPVSLEIPGHRGEAEVQQV